MRSHRKDPCFCGSGKKFKRCCGKEPNLEAGLIQVPAPPIPPESAHLSLHDRNMMLINAVGDIFGFRKPHATWETIKRNVTPDRIRALYMAIQSIWHADPKHLAPQPSSSLAALYLGDIEPEELARRVFRFGLYTDEIYIIDPFQFPTPPGQDPISKPGFYRYDTLHLISFLSKVEPWIRAGRLTLIPDPMQLDPTLWDTALSNGEKRRHLLGEPSPDEIAELRESLARRMTGEDIADQMAIFRAGTSLESMQRICTQSGAFPFTYSPSKWRELFLIVDKLSDSAKVWSPLTNAFSGLEFDFLNNVDPTFAARLRDEERLIGFRHFLKDLWQKAGATPDLSNAESAAKEFRERLGEEHRKAKEEWAQIRKDVFQWGMTTAGGTVAGMAQALIITGGISLTAALVTAALAAVTSAVGPSIGQKLGLKNRKQKLRVTLPMSIFIDLSEYRKKPSEGMALSPS